VDLFRSFRTPSELDRQAPPPSAAMGKTQQMPDTKGKPFSHIHQPPPDNGPEPLLVLMLLPKHAIYLKGS
jgi:hypothetical protein